jgi:hypothetical protein
MGMGLKTLTQVSRSAQKKQNDGTYHEEDSGVGISDLEEESSPADMLPSVSESHGHFTYPGGYPSQQQRVPSIQSMIHPVHPTYQQHPSQYLPQQHHMPHSQMHPHHPQ